MNGLATVGKLVGQKHPDGTTDWSTVRSKPTQHLEFAPGEYQRDGVTMLCKMATPTPAAPNDPEFFGPTCQPGGRERRRPGLR